MDDYDRHMIALAAGREFVQVRTAHGYRPATLRAWDPDKRGAQALVTMRVDGADVLLPEADQ